MLSATLLGLLVGLGAGCETFLTGGNPVHPTAARSLAVGLPYAEVVAELGPPVLYLDARRVIAYPWDTSRGDVSLATTDFMGRVNPDRVVSLGEVGVHCYALCLRFDSRQRLQTWTNLVTASQPSLQQAMRDWAKPPVPAR